MIQTKNVFNLLNSFMAELPIYIATSPLICRTNQWTGFCMIGTSFMKELKLATEALWHDGCPDRPFLLTLSKFRGVFRTQSNVYNEAFLRK